MTFRDRFAFSILVCCVTLAGCGSDLPLNKIPTLPAHWSNVPGRGTDSKVGSLKSTKLPMVIHYDIGHLAGEYADATAYPDHKWIKSGRLAGSSFRYLLTNGDTLYVTFPDDGPANYWTQVKGQSDIDYAIELLARHRKSI